MVRYTAWTWLGWATTVAGAIWALVGTEAAGRADIWAPSLFVAATAALNLALLPRAALDHEEGAAAELGSVRRAWRRGAAAGGVLRLPPGRASACCCWFRWRSARGCSSLAWTGCHGWRGLLFLLSLLLWALPEWQPTGEAITVDGVIEAVLPGAWAPAVIVPCC